MQKSPETLNGIPGAYKTGLVFLMAFLLSGCVAAVVGTAADVTLEVVKVPFKLAGAVVDVATPDGDDDDGDEDD